jgi:hypothetical protein
MHKLYRHIHIRYVLKTALYHIYIYLYISEAFKIIYAKDGIKSFWSGWQPKIVESFIKGIYIYMYIYMFINMFYVCMYVCLYV